LPVETFNEFHKILNLKNLKIMKKFYFLTIALCVLNGANALAGEYGSTGLNTDTIHKLITDFQSDSLIKANQTTPGFYILDIRTPTEFSSGHLINANNIDYRAVGFWDVLANLDRNLIYLVHCKGGSRSLPTYNQMVSLHFREVYMMVGGFDQWKLDGFPYLTGSVTNTEELKAPTEKLNIYPNPANSKLTIEIKIPINTTTLSIINTNGQEMIMQRTTDNKFTINISQLPHGVYFVKLLNVNGIQVSKFVKD